MSQNTPPIQLARPGWADSKAAGIILLVAYLVAASLPIVLAWALRSRTGAPFVSELGKGAALVGFMLLVLQVVLSARFRFVDRPFGCDVVMQFHKRMALLAGVLLMAHPILLAVGHGSFSLFSSQTSWRVNLGKAALLLLLVAILFALFFPKLRLDYQLWRALHKGVMVVIVLGFVHALVIGSDVAHMKVYWWLLFLVATGVFAYRNLLVPLWGRRRFRVTSVAQEAHKVWTLTLEPEDGRAFAYRPGQFMFLKLLREGLAREEHPFTISSSPTQAGGITATIKESGNYTSTIGKTKPDDRALIEAPFGRFSLVHHQAKRFLFIAGGVGITPIMSMLRFLRDTEDERPVTFIYGNRTGRDIIFREELEKLPQHMRVVHVLSEPESDWDGRSGYVTTEVIKECAGEFLDETCVYVCGPPAMMKLLIDSVRSLGVKSAHVHYERFAL